MRGASFIRNDLSLVVAELREEQDEHERQQADPDEIPALQVSDVDFSYGQVQVLFDVGFEVRRGEVLALLGTNGAGKSTILRVIAGLGTPRAASCGSTARTITYVAPEQRVQYGHPAAARRQGRVPGDDGRARTSRWARSSTAATHADRERADRPGARAVPRARRPPGPARRRRCRAASSRCWRSAITLLHEPEVLLIDELSLGLSPIVVQELLGVVEQLKARGHDDRHRRAVAERRAGDRRPGDLPREGPGALRGAGRRAAPNGTTWPGPCSSAPRAAERCSPRSSPPAVFDGVVTGLVYGLLAMGIVLVYRATRVINFAVGNMGLVGAGLFVLLVVQYDVPVLARRSSRSCVGTCTGRVIELDRDPPAVHAPRVIVLVATIGIAQLSLAILVAYPEVDVPGARFPQAIGAGARDRRRPDHRAAVVILSWCRSSPSCSVGTSTARPSARA